MCGTTILPFVTNEPMLEIDYAEDLPQVEQALKAQRDAPLEPPHGTRLPV